MNLHLRRFCFPIPGHIGIGVTAYSRAEAASYAELAAAQVGWSFVADAVVEDIDLRDLDQNHVVPNMAPVNLHGVWFPALSL